MTRSDTGILKNQPETVHYSHNITYDAKATGHTMKDLTKHLSQGCSPCEGKPEPWYFSLRGGKFLTKPVSPHNNSILPPPQASADHFVGGLNFTGFFITDVLDEDNVTWWINLQIL